MFTIIRLADNCDYDALEEMGFFGIDASCKPNTGLDTVLRC
jgi:hypothetical protein